MTPDPVSRQLYDATVDFVLAHQHPDVKRFQQAVSQGVEDWVHTESVQLPATRHLTMDLSSGQQSIDKLLKLYAANKDRLKWEQSYTRADGVVGEDMLSGYGFAEIIGKLGPFVSHAVRCGIGVWGPAIEYPRHTHKAEEVYLVMSGSARFKLGQGQGQAELKSAGDVIYVKSMTPHGFTTEDQAMVVFYLWQAGDLREISTFG